MNTDGRKRSDGLETMDRLIEFAEKELNEVGPVKFNLGTVLAKAEISRSSAYHHFGNREGVIAAVELKHHIESMRGVNELLRMSLEETSDPSVLLKRIEFHLGFDGTHKGQANRRRRIFTLAAAQSSEVLAARISEEQRNIADYLVETIALARKKKFIKPRESDMAIAQMMLSIMFGRALVDLTGRADDDEAWARATMASLRYLLNVQE